jgi:ubiquinone/menaquinone biosynthesis C-methylase UbiE
MSSLLNRSINTALRAFFYLLYHQMAWSYDWVAAAVSLGQWRNWVMEALPYLKGPRILELGFGPGHLQLALFRKGFQPVGLDESTQMIQFASRRLSGFGFRPNIVKGYAQTEPFSENFFDQVVSTFPSEYIFQTQALSEIYRVLVPGGKLVAIPFAWPSGNQIIHRSLVWLFHATGQAPAQIDSSLISRLTHPFEQTGYHVEVKIMSTGTTNINSGKVLILLATKPPL